MTCKNAKTIFFAVLIAAAILPYILVDVYALHASNTNSFESHIWSRSTADGHTGLLNCDSSNDYCAVKIKVTSGVQTLSKNTIISKVNAAETVFDNLGKKMSIDRVSSGTTNELKQGNLPSKSTGQTSYDLHCTKSGWFGCNTKDMHFIKMTVTINNDSSSVKIRDYEDGTSNPKVADIDKVVRHELFHAMGIDHNDDKTSLVHSSYTFGTHGLTPSTTDIRDLGNQYP